MAIIFALSNQTSQKMNKTILIALLAAFLMNQAVMGQVRIYPLPEKDCPELKDDYKVSVCPDGDSLWQTVPTLRCDVDLRCPQQASFAEFDMQGKVRVRIKLENGKTASASNVVIRPKSKNIGYTVIDNRTIELQLDAPEYLSVEFSGDRLHNLHLFANPWLEEQHTPDEPRAINWMAPNAQDVFVRDASLIYFGPGVHRPKDLPGGDIRIPSNCTIYLAPGAIVKARLVVDHAENVRIVGRGILDHPLRGIEITYSKNVLVDGLTVLNPQHYTVFGGQSEGITLRHLKSFSCKSWTDGIDLMCCNNVKIENVFLRTSDDAIALYNHRWWFWGGSRGFDISRATLWTDVAHPINIGTHGDDRSDMGETLENVRMYDCDILYARTNSLLNVSCGDKNTINDVVFDDIRIEGIESSALIGVRVVFGSTYNRAPGNLVTDINFHRIRFMGDASQLKPCFFDGYDEQHRIGRVTLDNILVNGRPLNAKDINIGRFVESVVIKP